MQNIKHILMREVLSAIALKQYIDFNFYATSKGPYPTALEHSDMGTYYRLKILLDDNALFANDIERKHELCRNFNTIL